MCLKMKKRDVNLDEVNKDLQNEEFPVGFQLKQQFELHLISIFEF